MSARSIIARHGSSGQNESVRANGIWKSPRDRVTGSVRAAVQHVADNPLASVAGAAAITAGIAMLVPSGRREAKLMGDLAGKVGDAARTAADTIIDSGRTQVQQIAAEALATAGEAVLEKIAGPSAQS